MVGNTFKKNSEHEQETLFSLVKRLSDGKNEKGRIIDRSTFTI